MRTRQLLAVAGFFSALVGLTPSARTDAASFQGLGYLQGSTSYSQANAVSGDGTTIVGVSGLPNGTREAFLWTPTGGMQGLGALPGTTYYSDANAISDDGSAVVGYSNSASGEEAFLWTAASGMTGLGNLPGSALAAWQPASQPTGQWLWAQATIAMVVDLDRWPGRPFVGRVRLAWWAWATFPRGPA